MKLDNENDKITPFWRKLGIIVPVIVVAISSVVSSYIHYQNRQDPEKNKLTSYEKQITKNILKDRKPVFLIYDFLTYGDDQDLGKIYSNLIMSQIFSSGNSDEIKIVERMSMDSIVEFQKKLARKQNIFKICKPFVLLLELRIS